MRVWAGPAGALVGTVPLTPLVTYSGQPATIPFNFTLFEPGTAINETLTVQLNHGCGNNAFLTINSVAVDVVGLK